LLPILLYLLPTFMNILNPIVNYPMNKRTLTFAIFIFIFSLATHAQLIGPGSRMNEIFQRTDLAAGPTRLYDPWEVTYGPDGFLWITEARPYKVYRMNPNTGAKIEVVDLSDIGSFTPSSFKRTFAINNNPWPQGGLAGLAVHPDFMKPVSPKNYVYISYVKTYTGGSAPTGRFFINWLVRFTYNTGTDKLENPVALCDTLPGSNDHNSQRMIIAPVNGVDYLFYAQGDMGAGQFDNLSRPNKAQDTASYEGKILRFNLEDDGDAGTLDKWIPNDNPFNTTSPAKQSAVWATGIRNNQGFAYDSVRNILYGAAHGPFSDDEINIFERAKNYGHPRVIGYSTDHNYDGAKAGAAGSSLPLIYDEEKYATDTIGAGYRDPIFSFYPAPKGNGSTLWSIQHIYINADMDPGAGTSYPQNQNNNWASDGISGLGLYNNSMIPGWKNSLMVATLKGGKIARLKLSSDGLSVIKTAPYDTISYFRSVNRFRDVAFAPDGNTIYTIIDSSSTTSGPSTGNPIISACRGCVQKYTFLGYAASGGTSTISNYIPIADGKPDICENANTININTANANYWVPVTDTNSNIVAEINANGNILGNVTTSVFVNTGAVREQAGTKTLYLDRNITITPQTQPSTPVSIRLYLNNTEFTALSTATNSLGQPSSVVVPTNLAIFKNSDGCGPSIGANATRIVTSNQSAFGTGGYVVQADISSFSTFYIASVSSLLPVHLTTFKGSANNDIAMLTWATEDEMNVQSFTLERSLNSRDFYPVTTLQAIKIAGRQVYTYPDSAISKLLSPVIYYRLKTTDAEGKNNYSSVISIRAGNNKAVFAIHPNPVENDVIVDIHATVAEQARWEITDIAGKTVLQHSVVLTKGKNVITIKLANIPAGVYYLKVAGNNISQAVKLQKL